ncbi:unnamed protein product [Bathycoccus prasinos]
MHQEVEFIAEDIEVEVTPNFTSPTRREAKVLLFKNVGTLDVPCNNFFTLMLIADFILRSSKSQTCSALACSELKEAE